MVALGSVILVLTAANVAAAEKPTPPVVEWNDLLTSDVKCVSGSNLEVKASANPDAELSDFSIGVRRFEAVFVGQLDILAGPNEVEV